MFFGRDYKTIIIILLVLITYISIMENVESTIHNKTESLNDGKKDYGYDDQ